MTRNRHPSVQAILPYFEYDHLPRNLQNVSRPFYNLAMALVGENFYSTENADYTLELSGPELTVALRKLLEAKDCAVRAAL